MITGVEIENVSRDLDHAHFRGDLLSLRWDLIGHITYLCTKFEDCSCSRSRDIVDAHRNLNGSRDLDHAPLRDALSPWASTCHVPI